MRRLAFSVIRTTESDDLQLADDYLNTDVVQVLVLIQSQGTSNQHHNYFSLLTFFGLQNKSLSVKLAPLC